MFCTASTLRSAAVNCRAQPSLLTTCTYHASTSRSQDSISSTERRVSLPKRHVTFKSSRTSIRSASTTSPSSSPPNPSSSRGKQAVNAEILDWNTYFQLRRTRRFYQLGSSIGSSFTGFVGGAQILTRSDMDALVGQIPLDPFITLGLITFTCGAVGWLMGPVLGTAAFNLQNRKFRTQMDAKEKEFYRRIKVYRVDPSASSMANPVPDYYGEKIASVAGYRRWLKDQRAFNKKRHTYV